MLFTAKKISHRLTVVSHRRMISPSLRGCLLQDVLEKRRGIAQSGSASGLGPEGREFESLCPDHFKYLILPRLDILNAPVAHLDRASAF